jgi:glucokinase
MAKPALAPVAHDKEHPRFPILIGDIGGTNARFAVIEDVDAEVKQLPIAHTDDHKTIEDAIERVVIDGGGARPRSAILAVAGPISGDRVDLTNSDWMVEPKVIIKRFGIGDIILLNDFEAQSLALPVLEDHDLDPIGGGKRLKNRAQVVVGPGTGLGAGALVHGRNTWIPIPGEGGHIDFAPASARDFAIWPHLENVNGRVSGETLLSGGGIVRLYRGICATDGATPVFSEPAEITGAGLSGDNPQAVETVALFATYLGRFAGNLALVFMARGGVYLGGGIATKIAPALKSGAFRQAFVDKAPHQALLEEMATAIITNTNAALVGIGAMAKTPGRFAPDLAGRRWRA